MKKIVALTSFFIVAVAIGYSSINWDSDNEAAGTENVTLSNGNQMALNQKEAALSANPGEKKVVLTGLGLF